MGGVLWASDLVAALSSGGSLEEAYATSVERLCRLPLWSPENPQGSRIPWRSAASARRMMPDEFASPGLYMFGATGIPLYIGMTEQPLWKRLTKRYLQGPCSQCQLAQTYGDLIREKGVDGFPEHVRRWYRQRFGGSSRLEGAVGFARRGIESVWFALIPVADQTIIGCLEKRLIPIANKWNLERDYEGLLNRQHNR